MNHIVDILKIFGASVLIGSLIPFVLSLAVQRDRKLEIGIILVVLSIVGSCAGLAGGMSRIGAVGSIIPAFLGLLGGLSIYLFGVDRSKGLIASFGTAALSLSLIISYTAGSQFRNIGDDHRDIRSICAAAYSDWELLSNGVAYDKFRERLGGLCDRSMSWHIAQ
ncbi:hypothetical protein [Roseovarius sp. M141]|uniref:hypothetical protein n=1 Tax=Roseovarius sp. M141 TaxID=2583806 RepID=UPI0020CCF748|nr:hypothetical protein [Roseovarius sp. M141]MCQ0093380.1 hypothetical protein [Roseovarius sp. M141]